MENIYADIAERTGGNIYIGVVGPVRTGKSTLIKQIMEALVIPHIRDPYQAERAKDELPQSGSGRTIMTSEPKFVPEEAIEISPDGTTAVRIRMIDSVGYMVNGAVGAEEDGVPRLVSTPWCEQEIPIAQAAELGTKKVMQDHCTIGLVVTTDGTVTDIPRSDYTQAEAKAIRDMQATGKPYLVVVNSARPGAPEAQAVKEYITNQYGAPAVVADCQSMDTADILQMLTKLLYTFPVGQLAFHFPRWMDALEAEHPVKAALYQTLLECALKVTKLDQLSLLPEILLENSSIVDAAVRSADLGSGNISCQITFAEPLFYEILSSKAGLPIPNDSELLKLLTELSKIKKEYDQISEALAAVKATGYGIVMPGADQMRLETPELVRKGNTYGIKLKAGAPSIHMIRVDIDTQINPMVGGEQQSLDLIASLTGEDPDKLWQSNIFGKSVYDLVQEGLTAKLLRTPEDVREKIRGSLSKIVNEGAAGLVCLIF